MHKSEQNFNVRTRLCFCVESDKLKYMKVYTDYSLLAHNTFGIEARTRYFAEYQTVDELRQLVNADICRNNRVLHIGSGSNLLFVKDFDGVILHSAVRFMEYSDGSSDDVTARIGSGVVWDDFCADAARRGLWGVENLASIPGEAGSSAVQNVGAYGVEACDVIEAVEVFDRKDCTIRIIPAADCDYGYRHSRFKTDWKERYFVTAVRFRLSRTPRPRLGYAGLDVLTAETALTPERVRLFVSDIRRKKLPDPDETGSAGSFFKNPVIGKDRYLSLLAAHPSMPHYPVSDGMVKVPAAWLIEQCGLKGRRIGGAQVYGRQPLVIVNAGNATSADIVGLADMVRQEVYSRFGIDITPEVNYIY